MTQPHSLALVDGPVTFAGAISLDTTGQGVQPWRLIHDDYLLFEKVLREGPASHTAGIRATTVSDTSQLLLEIADGQGATNPGIALDLLVDGQFHERVTLDELPATATFSNLPKGEHRLEVYLPQKTAIRVNSISIDKGATAKRWEDPRPKWLVYGSSITQSAAVNGPSETWPALVSQWFDLNLTCVGYGGGCHMEPVVARMLRDQPADYISLCLGINMMGAGSYSQRTFRAGVLGTILTIRDSHPDTPMVVVSPISNPPREEKPNVVEMTLVLMREIIAQAVDLLQKRGDKQLHYVDGLTLYGHDLVHHMPDQLHPDHEGYRVMAEQYTKVVMPTFGLNDKRAKK